MDRPVCAEDEEVLDHRAVLGEQRPHLERAGHRVHPAVDLAKRRDVASQRVVPRVALERGFQWEFPTLDAAIEERLTKRARAKEQIAKSKSRKEAAKPEAVMASEGAGADSSVAVAPAQRSDVARDVDVPEPPFWGSRVIEGIDLNEVYAFVNKVALYRGQWQYKKGRKSDEDFERQVREEVDPIFARLCEQCRSENILSPKVVYGWWPVASEGESLIVFDPDDRSTEIERFTFPRQEARKRLCISDFFRDVDSGERDVLGPHPEGDGVAGPDLLEQGHVLAAAGQRPVAVVDTVPALGHDGR